MKISTRKIHRTHPWISSLVMLLAATVAPGGCDEPFHGKTGDVSDPGIQRLAEAQPAPSSYVMSYKACMSYYADASYCCVVTNDGPYYQCYPYWGE